jgi:hypothetical protein
VVRQLATEGVRIVRKVLREKESEKMMTLTDIGLPDETVAAIVYQPEGKRKTLVPFTVFTYKTHNGLLLWSEWDFDFCRRDGRLYYHCSGCGPSPCLNVKVTPAKPPLCAVWWDSAVVASFRSGDGTDRVLDADEILAMGYTVMTEPKVSGFAGNPFFDASNDSTEWCSRCRDRLPKQNLCRHIWWCSECGMYSTPGCRCGHREGGAK